tara:strand:+ start:271 stop:1566 length:1296 start_codon:yes stop_codon:yes gene_type:complete
MSNLLDQAIIDAEALKEVAMRNAEAAILDKFSGQIKEAVEQILDEQPEEEPVEDFEAGEEEASEGEELVDDLTPGSAEGVKMCACPEIDDNMKVTFDLKDLEQKLAMGPLEDAEALAGEIDAAAEETEDKEGFTDLMTESVEINDEDLEEIIFETTGLNEEFTLSEEALEEMISGDYTLEEDLLEELMAMLDEDTFIDDPDARAADIEGGALAGDPEKAAYAAEALEESKEDVVEEALTVDIDPLKTQKSGWLNTPQGTFQLAEEELLAMLEDSERREKFDEMKKALKKLQESNKKLENNINRLKGDKKELINVVGKVKDKLNETNLANAKLLYTNKVLISDSLNERQKNKIAEALSNSESVEEAKVIYETLQSATGSTIKNKKPESLSEATNRTTSTLILSHRKRDRENTTQNDSSINRWKILAGLNNKQ